MECVGEGNTQPLEAPWGQHFSGDRLSRGSGHSGLPRPARRGRPCARASDRDRPGGPAARGAGSPGEGIEGSPSIVERMRTKPGGDLPGVGGVFAERWGVTAPFWFAFVGSAVFVVLIWRQLAHIAHADDASVADASVADAADAG